MGHQAFIFSSEAGVNLVQSLGELTETYFSMSNCLDPIVIKIINEIINVISEMKNCWYESYVRWFKVSSAVFTWKAWQTKHSESQQAIPLNFLSF